MTVHVGDPVRLLMSQPVLCVAPKTSIREVARFMRDHHFGVAVVFDNGEPVGMVTKTDVVRAIAEEGDPDTVWAADIMSEEPPYVTPETSVLAAAHRLVAAGMRYLIVEDEDELVGIVSVTDVLRAVVEDAAHV